MTFEQAATFVILGGLLALLIWDRIRYDLVALSALLTAIAVGIVEPQNAFRGFSDDIVIIVGSALVVSAAVARSGIAETVMRPLSPYMKTTEIQIVVLVSLVAAMSAVMKNIGALAILMPLVFQLARRNNQPVSRLLMPLSFGALLGGLMTLIGTSPNVIVSRMREEIVGEPFGMFDFTPVGLALTVAGVTFLAFGWRLLPRTDKSAGSPETLFAVEDYQAEVRLRAESPFVGKTVQDLEEFGEGEVSVAAIIREKFRRYIPAGHWTLFADDILVLQCDAHVLGKIVSNAKLELLHDDVPDEETRQDELVVIEAVVTPESPLIGRSVEDVRLRDRYGVSLLAISRRGSNISTRLRRVRFRAGDLVVVRLRADDVTESFAALGLLPLAERKVKLGRSAHPAIAPAVLAIAMILAATGTASVAVAFFGAAVAVLLLNALTIREAYDAIDWPILILLGALIPVSEALRETGGSELIAGWLSFAVESLPPAGAVAAIMVVAMAVTPFLNNAATVLLMAPIGASLAARLELNADPFLMAVAIGAACDFLTPVGHQCNTLVWGPGGYRFSDYWRLGLPLSVMVVSLGVPLILVFWPLR